MRAGRADVEERDGSLQWPPATSPAQRDDDCGGTVGRAESLGGSLDLG